MIIIAGVIPIPMLPRPGALSTLYLEVILSVQTCRPRAPLGGDITGERSLSSLSFLRSPAAVVFLYSSPVQIHHGVSTPCLCFVEDSVWKGAPDCTSDAREVPQRSVVNASGNAKLVSSGTHELTSK